MSVTSEILIFQTQATF